MRSASASGEQHRLELGRQRATVTEVGATLRSWQVDGREVLDTFGPDSPGDAYRGKVLMPWPNRLGGGRYAFAGRSLSTPLTEPDRGNAMHGLVNWVNWHVTERTPSSVTLAHRLHAQPGYPFVLDLGVGYALTAGGLAVTLRAVNRGPTPAPFGAGLHPYFSVGGRADDVDLRIPARSWLPVDDREVPTGEVRPVAGTDRDFAGRRRIGEVQLDTCFTDVQRDADGLARVVLGFAGDGRGDLTIWMDAAFGHIQVYTGDEDPDPGRRRKSVAVEPMTCAPDAFNSGRGLLVLEPGQEFAGRCGVSLTAPGTGGPA